MVTSSVNRANPDKPERLAIITHEYFPVLSGGTIMVEKLAAELGKLGWEVDVLTCRIGTEFPHYERCDGFDVYRFSTGRRSTADSTLFELLSYFGSGLPQMLAHARKRRYTMLFPIFAIPSGLIGLTLSKLLRIPTVVFVDAGDTPGLESTMKTYVQYLAGVFRMVVNRSRAVVVCEGLEDLVEPYLNHRRFTAIPNGTVLPAAEAHPNRNGAVLQLLSIGRLVLRKGFLEIVEALGIVRRQRSDFHLRIVGYGRAEDEIRRVLEEHSIADNVSLLGRVEYQQLGEYFLNSDAYLFYGDREGSSLAMIEAGAYGLPVIASDHPGNRTYVKNGESGFLVEYKNPEALAQAILFMLEHREDLPEMGRRSRDIAKMYSWSNIAARYDDLLRAALGRS
jgi:glycosyltransferase involved in cell wall biosynthesis